MTLIRRIYADFKKDSLVKSSLVPKLQLRPLGSQAPVWEPAQKLYPCLSVKSASSVDCMDAGGRAMQEQLPGSIFSC